MPHLHIRKARPFDAGAMASLLNDIIAIGGTTALQGPLSGDELRDWMSDDRATWHVAEMGGDIVGFQWIEPQAGLPPDAASIATFTKPGHQGLGIGSALFDATKKAAKAQGLRAIHAIIADYNEGGRAYYRSRGFERVANAAEGKVVKVYRL
ncbi:MAG: GNAT family N-acetyltransferase [Pseudomonadota bacterium]